MKNISKRIVIHASFLVLAIFVTMLTTLGSVEVFEKSDLYTISCGKPLNFITQDQGWRDPPYPWKVPCFASPLESPTKFYWQYFILDTAFFYLFILALYHSKNLIVKKK